MGVSPVNFQSGISSLRKPPTEETEGAKRQKAKALGEIGSVIAETVKAGGDILLHYLDKPRNTGASAEVKKHEDPQEANSDPTLR